MTQADPTITSGKTGTEFRTLNNDAQGAMLSTHAGTSRPSYIVSNMMWIDTSASPALVLKFYDGTDDITVGQIDTSGNTFKASGLLSSAGFMLATFSSSFGTTAGSANTYTLSPGLTRTAYTTGELFLIKMNATNSGASTININSLGAKTIKKNLGDDLQANDLLSGAIYPIVYDGTNFQLLMSGGANLNYLIGQLTEITTLEDADTFLVGDSSDSNKIKKITKANLEASLSTSLSVFTNYFGDGSDGDDTISTNTNLTSTLDGDPVIKNYGNLTVDAGVTLSVSNRCKGLIIYCDGNLTVNGTISMTKKGANAAGASLSFDKHVVGVPSGTASGFTSEYANQETVTLTNFPISSAGANGGAGGTSGAGTAGTAGTAGKTGGGGGGGKSDSSEIGGDGAAGTSYSGGSGGGAGCTTSDGSAGAANGGAGGAAGTGSAIAGGGAGNPGGTGRNGGVTGETGTGGRIILIVKGNVTIGAAGSIVANGGNGGDGDTSSSGGAGGGGGSGGGAIDIIYGGTYTNNGSVTANGGSGGTGGAGTKNGGAGGAGSIRTNQVYNNG